MNKTSWTQTDVHGALYVYVRGRLVLKRWPSGRERLFQVGGFPDDELPSRPPPKLYKQVHVFLNGKLLKEF